MIKISVWEALKAAYTVSRDGADRTETPESVIDRFGELGDAGAQTVLFSIRDVWRTEQIELLGSTLIPALRDA